MRGTIRERKLRRRRARAFEDHRIGYECVELGPRRYGARATRLVPERRQERHLRIRNSGTGGLDRRLAGTTLARVVEDPILRRAQADDRHRGERERKYRESERLTTFVGHGVHSMSRAASPRTMSAGRPINESGAAMA